MTSLLETQNRICELIPPSKLKHIEGFSKKRVQWLKNKIINENLWTRPICIDRSNFLVMDGQHRMEVALALNLKHVPCLLYDYTELEIWSLRESEEVTVQLVLERTLEGNPYPYKTVKHKFPNEELITCSYALDELY